METLRAFIPSFETRIRQLNVLRRNGGKQARDFIGRHPVLAILAGIVGVCSLPALVCMAFFAALSIMVFFSVQGTLAGLTCVALATVVGPVFMTGLSVAIFCYVFLKIVQGVYRIVKYVASITFQIWTKAITVIENMAESGQPSSYAAPTSLHASLDDSHSFQEPAPRPVNQTVHCQSDLRSVRIIDGGCLPSAMPDFITVNTRPNELFFGHAALIDGEPIRIKVSSSERRKAFPNIFGGRDPVEVQWPELPSIDNGRVSKERYKKRMREIEQRACQSSDDDSDLPNAVGKNGNSHKTPTRNRNKKQTMNNEHDEVYRKTGEKPMRQGSGSESDARQTGSRRQYSEKGLRRKQSRSHFTSQEYLHRVFDPMYRGEPEGYRRVEQTQTRSSDGEISGGYSSRTACNNRKQQHASADERSKRQAYGRMKALKFVMSESEVEGAAEQLMRTSDSGRSAVSGERERYRHEERVHRIRSSETNSDSEQSDPVFYNNRRRKLRVTKKYSDHEWERGMSRNHNSHDEPPFNKEPVPTSSRRRQVPNKSKCSHKSRDRGSCDHYRVHCSGQRKICSNHKAAENSHPWDTRVAPSPSWASRSEHIRGTDYNDVTTSDEREFYDAMEEATSNDEEYFYY